AATPTLNLCDALVALILTTWTGRGASDGAERAYFKDVADADGGNLKIEGRRVVIYPTGYDNGPADRGEEEYTHNVTVDVFEPYPANTAGDPTTAWIDTRVDFVHEQIVQGFDFSFNGPASFNKKLYTRSAKVSVVNVDTLLGRNKLFWSRIELEFGEIRDA
ncbi:hypothetical protein B7486_75020, partial [cyanobacterium TDX16]